MAICLGTPKNYDERTYFYDQRVGHFFYWHPYISYYFCAMKYILANIWLRNICLYTVLVLINYQASPDNVTGYDILAVLMAFCMLYCASMINNIILIPDVLPKHKWRGYLFALATLLVFMTVTDSLVQTFLPKPPDGFEWSWTSSLVASSMFLLVGFGINSAYREIMRRQSLLEQELLSKRNELRFLQNQVNPHFLFNALNNLYSASITEPEKVSERILQMAELLRYQLSSSKRESVPLREEVDFLTNYIDVEKRRLGRQALITLEKTGDFKGQEIAPLLFLPFLENAFKYSTGGSTPAIIQIKLESTPSSIHFYVQNTLPEGNITPKNSTRIGIENVQKRLELLYPQRYELAIMSVNAAFSVDLTVRYELNLKL